MLKMANWEHKIRTEEELKELVRAVYDCKIFTSLQCDDYLIGSVFMPSMFMGASPSKPSNSTNNQINRKNKLQYIADMIEYEEDTPKREEFLKTIGMLYEDNSKAGPRAINGFPMFMSCNIVSISDTKRFIEMYTKYEKMREEFENEWK